MSEPTKKTGIPIDINWYEVLAPSTDPVEVCFTSSAAEKGKMKKAGEWMSNAGLRRDITGMSDEELREQIAELSDGKLQEETAVYGHKLPPVRNYTWERRCRLRPLLMGEARTRGIDVSAAEDADDRAKRVYTFGPEDAEAEYASKYRVPLPIGSTKRNYSQDADDQAKRVYTFGLEDAEYASKYCMSLPIRSTKRNCGQLGVNTHRSLRQDGQRNAIPVHKMYSSKSSSKALYGNTQGVHALDSDEDDSGKWRHNGNSSCTKSTRRREVQQIDSSLLHFQKVQHVVLLDDDVQPEEPGDCGVPDKWNESEIYYASRDDHEAVELTSSAIKCLDPGVCLSSPVINYYIQYIKREMLNNESHRDKFHIFNTYFYSKLPEALLGESEFLKLRRWWKGVNIFQRGYIILPIHGMAHWSLIVICIPAKESNSGLIILHLDSLEMHPSAEIFGIVRRYLEAEWCHLKKNPPSDISISETVWEDLPRNIHNQTVQVPQQTNGYDCGIFMLYYILQFISEAPDRFTREKLNMFSRSWFKPEDASGLRMRIRKLLLKEFESATVLNLVPEVAKSGGSDGEGIMNEGEAEEAVSPSDSSEMVTGGADTSISNEGIAEVGSLEETCSSAHRRDDRIRECVLSETDTYLDGKKDDTDTMKVDSDSSETEQEIDILPYRPKNNQGVVMHAPPDRDVYVDSSDSDIEDVKIIGVRNQNLCMPSCCTL